MVFEGIHVDCHGQGSSFVEYSKQNTLNLPELNKFETNRRECMILFCNGFPGHFRHGL